MSEQTTAATGTPVKPDYTKLEGFNLLEAIGTDPVAWAEATLQHANIVGGHITHRYLTGWFAKALGTAHAPEAQASIARIIGELKIRSQNLDKYEASLDDRAKTLESLEAELVGKMQAFEDRVREADAASQGKPEPQQGKPTIDELEKILNSGSTDKVNIEADGTVTVAKPEHPPSDPEE